MSLEYILSLGGPTASREFQAIGGCKWEVVRQSGGVSGRPPSNGLSTKKLEYRK